MARKPIHRPPPAPGPVPDAFTAACERAGVAASDRAALFALHLRWVRKGLSEEARVAAILADYGHWQLFQRSRQGDPGASREFERHWKRFLGALCKGRFGGDAEEVAASFFERVYRRFDDHYPWDCPFPIYLRAMALNVAREHDRARRRRGVREQSLEEDRAAAATPSRAPSPLDQLLEAERLRSIERSLADLSPTDQLLVKECLIDGRPVQELARLLGTTRAAIYQRLHRARARLRESFRRAGHVLS